MFLPGKRAKTTFAIVLVLLMASVTLTAVSIQPAKAQTTYENMQTGASEPLPTGITPDQTIDTTAYLSVSPNPIGVGQTILVNMWIIPPAHVSHYFTGYTVTVTKPDGSTVTLGPMNSYAGDTTAWTQYVADQTGTWNFKFNFPGGYFSAGNYTQSAGSAMGGYMVSSFPLSCYYEPSSTIDQTLNVQTASVSSWPPSPLPTDYWTRPISPDNREWWSIAGNFPWSSKGGSSFPDWPADTNAYASNYGFIPWVEAPSTSHIVWRLQESLGGLIGGDWLQNSLVPMFGGATTPSIIYNGRCYQVTTLPGGESAFESYDLQTGQVYWQISPSPIPATAAFFGTSALYIHHEMGYGEVPGGTATSTGIGAYIVYIGGAGSLFSAATAQNVIELDPMTGAVVQNYSIPVPGGTLYADPYVLSVQTIGNPYYPFGGGSPPSYRLINWTIETGTVSFGSLTSTQYPTFESRVMNNISWPLGGSMFGACYDYETGIAATAGWIENAASQAPYGSSLMAASIVTGKLLWNITVPDTLYSPICEVADHGKFAVLMMNGYWDCFDLNTGNLLWKSERMDYPWGGAGFGAYAVQSAYGLLYREAYDGVYAFDWNTGKIVWHFAAPAPAFETPYTDNGTSVYSFNAGAEIADGKLYTYNTEHTPTEPITRGWRLFCINATSGEGIWNITGSMAPGGIADGYLTAGNGYDGYLYVFGKGLSATTVSAPTTPVPKGTPVLIQGTVFDQSPAQPGTPCVSAASMTTQMEYLHMQTPIDGIYHNVTMTGVPVTLTAISSDGTVTNIGTTTTNAYYGTFTYSWTPPNEDTYTITASFAGDDSYGSSSSAAGLLVGAAQASTSPTLQTTTDYTMTIVGSAVAVIIVVVIATVIIALLFRKRP